MVRLRRRRGPQARLALCVRRAGGSCGLRAGAGAGNRSETRCTRRGNRQRCGPPPADALGGARTRPDFGANDRRRAHDRGHAARRLGARRRGAGRARAPRAHSRRARPRSRSPRWNPRPRPLPGVVLECSDSRRFSARGPALDCSRPARTSAGHTAPQSRLGQSSTGTADQRRGPVRIRRDRRQARLRRGVPGTRRPLLGTQGASDRSGAKQDQRGSGPRASTSFTWLRNKGAIWGVGVRLQVALKRSELRRRLPAVRAPEPSSAGIPPRARTRCR